MFTFDLQLFAHKKGVSSTRNTLFALVPGKVAFERAGRYNRKVSVYPVEA
ncbi:MAG: hypothetical protein E7G65_01270 [Veillonella sp.]|nr:hypothetical protein [Veillonella sp.]MDU3822797.1 hypothetical protein [Veillonella sp.]